MKGGVNSLFWGIGEGFLDIECELRSEKWGSPQVLGK